MSSNFDYLKENGSLSRVNVLNLRFKNYSLEYLDSPWKDNPLVPIKKEWYIVGHTISNDSSESNFSNISILVNLLDLGEFIDKNNGLGDEISEESELIFSDKILKWCTRNGLPYNENDKLPIFGFRVWEFKRRLGVLCNDFRLYYELADNDIEGIRKNTPYRSLLDLYNNDLEKMKELLADRIWGESDITLRMKYNKISKKYEMVPYTDDHIKIAYFQLGMLMLGNSSEKIKYCKKCGNRFIYENAKKEDCPECELNQSRDRKRKHDEMKRAIKKDHNSGMTVDEISRQYQKPLEQIIKWIGIESKEV